jgi:hypothetical protein
VNTPASPFGPAVTRALLTAGWTPGRERDISGWTGPLAAEGYHLSDAAAAGLRSFGGLVIPPVTIAGPYFANDEPLNVDPLVAGSGHHELAEELTRFLGGDWYPFAEWLSYASVFVERSGWTVATGLGWIWELGRSVHEAVEFAALADRPLRCLAVTSPGIEPWPKYEP